MKKVTQILLVLTFIPSVLFAGNAHYVDCSLSADGDGSYSKPWNNITSVNNHNFRIGDDVYFKEGTVCTGAYLKIDWDGSAVDDVVVGAYSGEGKFRLNGKDRPIIDGKNTMPGDEYMGLIMKTSGTGYVTIENLRVQNSTYHGIQFSKQNNITVRNCFTYRTWNTGITFNYVITGLIENNTVKEASFNRKPGAALQVTAGFKDGTARNVIIRGNTVIDGYEGIGLYKSASYCLVENNVLYDNRSYQIYNASGSHHNVIRNNIVYSSTSDPSPPRAIVVSCESWTCGKISQCADHNAVYDNDIANAEIGISIGSNCPSYPIKDNKIYNNTVVDSTAYNFKFAGTGAGNEARNNISWTISSGSAHVKGTSVSGVQFSNNNYDEDPGGNANDNFVIGNPGLKKKTGWRAISAGEHDEDWWNLIVGSRNKDRGTHLTTVSTTEVKANSTVMVDSALFFWVGDRVGVDNDRDGTIDFIDLVDAVDKTNHILTLTSSHTYKSGGNVYLARLGDFVYFASGVDIGAHEYRIQYPKNFTIKP